ncbi:MAG: hypothetical protein LKF47_04380 [Megasphaera sp.]|nr:hypothetical protein [Megasphaera sp.]MCI1248048.1 hypothetical protein [Megasphaera sp.]
MNRLLVLTGLFVCANIGSVWAAPVEHVSVQVTSTQETIPPLVQKRIAASVQTVGNHVFLQQDDGEISQHLDSYERTINDIINRVLIGYTVERLTIAAGADTTLQVVIRPWGETIHSADIIVDYGSLPQMGQALANTDLVHAQVLVENLLVGLPVDALDWANGVVKTVMETELENMLPEFYPHIVITPGENAVVHVYMLPKLPVVRNANVSIEAENLPKVIFLSTRRNLEQRYEGLQGLPVAFVRRHEQAIQEDIQASLNTQWVIKQYKLHVTPSLRIGENTDIHLLSQTDFYDIRAGAYMDIGRDKNSHQRHDSDTVIKGHIGRKLGNHHEVYSEIEFIPGDVDWNVIPGYAYQWGKGSQLGYQYETEDDSNHFWFRQQLGKRWQFRYDRDVTHKDDEVGLTYRLHEYVGLEYIVSDHDHWLRIIGYL